jgi:hypothetical protein
MTSQITKRRLVAPKKPTTPLPVIGVELKSESKLDATSAFNLIVAKLLLQTSVTLDATSALEAKNISYLNESIILDAKSTLTAAAVPYKAAKFSANAVSEISTLNAKIQSRLTTKLDAKSALVALPKKLINMLPTTLAAKSNIIKCEAIVPPLVDGILIIGNPNSLGIDV